jgi:hypothetical protein
VCADLAFSFFQGAFEALFFLVKSYEHKVKGTKKDRPGGIPKNTSQTAKFRPNRPFDQSFRMPRVEALNHRLIQVLPKESLNWMAFPKELRPESSDSVNFARRFHRRL